MMDKSHLRLQLIFFSLVSAAFTNIYITQPILPAPGFCLGYMGGLR
jgi:MFS transporter, YNFM family, putative membrane transport protein